MAFMDGQRSRFRIADAGGVTRDLSGYITEVSGLPGARTLNDVAALGDSGARFEPGADATSFTLRGPFDDTATLGADAVLGALRYHDSPVNFEYAPAGLATGSVRYKGKCWVEAYEIRSKAGALVSWEARLQVEGATSRAEN